MKTKISTGLLIALVAVLACSMLWAEKQTDEVWMGNFMILKIRNSAGGYSIADRVSAIQGRTNTLLRENKTTMTIGLKKSGHDVNIYTDNKLYMTVTQNDAKANNTKAMALAEYWSARLKNAFLKSYPSCQQCRIKKL